ncbi:TlpA disulfide reductase family protein [Salinisphaera sp. T31B1]|uniref:TlpA family protein disulfide reductase n=1 Tax=Salinisphaera sp. T31B1 TaxID=727963 RepID=UPI003340A062
MKPSVRRWLAGLGLLTVAVAGVLGAYHLAGPDKPMRPAFTLADLSGSPRSISDFDGRVVVLNFWASWCAPCRKEIPMLVAAQNQWREQGLSVVGVAIDSREAAKAFAERYEINYPVLADATEGARIQDRYTRTGAPAGVLPFTAIIDRHGRVVARIAGAITHQQLADRIEPLLGDNAGRPD